MMPSMMRQIARTTMQTMPMTSGETLPQILPSAAINRLVAARRTSFSTFTDTPKSHCCLSISAEYFKNQSISKTRVWQRKHLTARGHWGGESAVHLAARYRTKSAGAALLLRASGNASGDSADSIPGKRSQGLYEGPRGLKNLPLLAPRQALSICRRSN